MRIVLLHNVSSGRGNRGNAGADLAAKLTAAGHQVEPLRAGPQLAPETLTAHARNADLVVVAGGDGTLHYALDAIAAAATPVYHYPLGTENLFARQFGMRSKPDALLNAIERNTVEATDLGLCNGRAFSLMFSIGFDAAVVQRVAGTRTGGVRRTDYAKHAVAEFRAHRPPVMTIHLDGSPAIVEQSGLVVVGNSASYAAGLNPARGASVTDGVLDLAFMPHASGLGVVPWLARLAASRMTAAASPDVRRAKEITIRAQGSPAPAHQIDGEACAIGATTDDGSTEFRLSIRPGALRVLIPA